MQMFGRTVIYTDVTSVTADNVRDVLTKALAVHHKNQAEIDYLYGYYKGKTPILHKKKEVRPTILVGDGGVRGTSIGVLQEECEAFGSDRCIAQVEDGLIHKDFHRVLIVDPYRRHEGIDQRARHIEDVAQGNGHRDAHHNRCRKEQRQLDPFADIQLAGLLSVLLLLVEGVK